MSNGKLSKLSLVNFRSYAKFELEFDGRPVAILGENGAGKTNLLEAISLFTPGRGLRRAERDLFARAPENIGWKLTLEGERGDETFAITNQAKFGEARQTIINDKQATQTAQGAWLRLVWMVPAMDRLWIDSASERRKFFDRIVLSFDPQHGENVMAYERFMRERNKLLKDGVSDASWYELIEKNMSEKAALIVDARAKALDALNVELQMTQSAFPVSLLSLTYDKPAESAEEWAQIWADTRRTDGFGGTTKFGPHKVSFDAIFVAKNQPAALCSTGEQKALLIGLVLANARALIASGEFVSVLLDEVAAHLDEGRRAALFDELCALDAHVFMTGTEENLFEAMGDRGMKLQVRESTSGSEVEIL